MGDFDVVDDDDEPPLLIPLGEDDNNNNNAARNNHDVPLPLPPLPPPQQQQQQQQQPPAERRGASPTNAKIVSRGNSINGEEENIVPCPVTILSGFLGSGKTTLVQYILKSPDHGKRIAVIENEFGGGGDGLAVESMIAMDGVDQSSLQDFIELPNGCVCCTVKDNLVATLENLLQKRADLDYILIEASGMANPGPIASIFWLDETLESRIRLDGVVTLVDCANIQKQIKETQEASQQIAYADRVVLNKMDLLLKEMNKNNDNSTDATTTTEAAATAETHQYELEKMIRAINPSAQIKTTMYSRIENLEWLLDTNSYGTDRVEEVDRILRELSTTDKEEEEEEEELVNGHHHHEHSHDHHHDHGDCSQCDHHDGHTAATNSNRGKEPSHTHTSDITTFALKQDGTVDLKRMNTWLAQILWPNQDAADQVLRDMLENPQHHTAHMTKDNNNNTTQQIFRIKGILSVHDENENDVGVPDGRRHIVQGVHDLWEIYPASTELNWKFNEVRCCKLIVIGRYLQSQELEKGFQSCFL